MSLYKRIPYPITRDELAKLLHKAPKTINSQLKSVGIFHRGVLTPRELRSLLMLPGYENTLVNLSFRLRQLCDHPRVFTITKTGLAGIFPVNIEVMYRWLKSAGVKSGTTKLTHDQVDDLLIHIGAFDVYLDYRDKVEKEEIFLENEIERVVGKMISYYPSNLWPDGAPKEELGRKVIQLIHNEIDEEIKKVRHDFIIKNKNA